MSKEKKWDENYEQILKNTNNSERAMEWSKEAKIEFLKRCENVYGKTTEQHILQFESEGYEGSPDMKRWYRFSQELENE